jgi:hypothetical protein
MKLVKILSVLLTVTILISCSNKALDFNNIITEHQREVVSQYDSIVETASQLDPDDTALHNSIIIQVDSFVKFANTKLQLIKNEKAPKGAEALLANHKAHITFMIEDLNYLKLSFNTNPTDEESKRLSLWQDNNSIKKDSIEKSLVESQLAFGKAKGIRFDTKE